MGIVVCDCNDWFASLRTVGDEVFLIDCNLFAISPKIQFFDLLAVAIEEGQLVSDRSGFILEDDLAFSDDGATADALSFQLDDELT